MTELRFFLLVLSVIFSLVDRACFLLAGSAVTVSMIPTVFALLLSSRLARTASRNDYIILFHIILYSSLDHFSESNCFAPQEGGLSLSFNLSSFL